MVRRHPVLSFFVLAYAVSWGLWLPLVYGRLVLGWTSWEGNAWTNGRTMLGNLGALGPAIAAVVMARIVDGPSGVKALLRRCVDWRVPARWWALAFYGWWAIATVLAAILQVAPLPHVAMQWVFALLNIPVIVTALQMPVLLGAFGEEAGWRGFALPRLEERLGPLAASLVLAVLWAFWHAPLALFPEWTGNRPLAVFAGRYLLLVVPLTIVFTWFFDRVGRSVLLAVVLHRTLNLTTNAYGEALGLSKDSGVLIVNGMIVVLWLGAAVIAVRWTRAPRHAGAVGTASPA